MSDGNEAVVEDFTDSDWDNIEDTAPVLEAVAEDVDGNSNEEVSNEEVSTQVDDEDDFDSVSEEKEVSKEEVAEEPEESDKDGEEDAEPAEESKSLDINTLGDEDLISVKVDGELQEVSLKEFKNGISGSKAVAQKFTELDTARKQYEQELGQVNTYINNFSEKMKQGDAIGALEYLGSFSGMGSHQIRATLMKSLLPEMERLEGLSQSEIDLEYQKSETDYLKQQYSDEQGKIKSEQAANALNDEIQHYRSELSIEDTEWENALSHLDKHLPANERITPELVAEYVQFDRADSRAVSSLEAADGNLVTQDNVDALRRIIEDNPDFTDEDIREIITGSESSAKNTDVEEKIEAQVKKTAPKRSPKQEASQEQKQPSQVTEFDADDWEDLF